MFRHVRGRAVIINNKYFVRSGTRDGCDNDVRGLEMLFSAIHFQVVPYADRTAQVCCVQIEFMADSKNAVQISTQWRLS